MKLAEVGALLTLIATYDNRNFTEFEVQSWHRVVGDLDYHDACDSVVAHYRTSRNWLMPADVLNGVKAIRARRASEASPYAIPAADPDDVPAYLAALRAGHMRNADVQPRPVEAVVRQAVQRSRRDDA